MNPTPIPQDLAVREIEVADPKTRAQLLQMIGPEALKKIEAAGFHLLHRSSIFWLLTSASNLHPKNLQVRI